MYPMMTMLYVYEIRAPTRSFFVRFISLALCVHFYVLRKNFSRSLSLNTDSFLLARLLSMLLFSTICAKLFT